MMEQIKTVTWVSLLHNHLYPSSAFIGGTCVEHEHGTLRGGLHD